ncbi:MAG: ROK family protein [Planctomycetales bacterium]|nr:ROK family protein [Planctomycetales bacterium]
MIGAIEIGGTKLQLAVAAETAPEKLLDVHRLPIDRQAGAPGILALIEQTLTQLTTRYSLSAIGVGFGGPVDVGQGRAITSHQVSGWTNFALRDWLQQRWPVPVAIDNDCNVAALAEARLGAGKACSRVLYTTVGTGIGGGFIINGQIDGQDRPAITEIGHLRPGLVAERPEMTVEAIASGLGIERTMTEALQAPGYFGCSPADADEFRQRLGDTPLSARFIAEQSQAGQLLALRVFADATQTLGWALAQATTLLAPHVIVIGGGVSLVGQPFFAAVTHWWHTYVFPPLSKVVHITPAALGEEVVLHGAIQLVLSQAAMTSGKG